MFHDVVRAVRRRVAQPAIAAVRRYWVPLRDAIKDAALGIELGRKGMVARPRQRGRGAGPLHVLMVDDLVPDALFGAGYPRAQAIVRALLRSGHRVQFYPMAAKRAHLRRMSGLFDGQIRFHPGEGASGLRRLLRRSGDEFDAILVSRHGPMEAFHRAQWHPADGAAAPVIYDAEAVLAPREALRRAIFDRAWSDDEYRMALDAELGPARGARAVTAVGAQDAHAIGTRVTAPVFVLSHPVAVRTDAPAFTDRQDLLFVGPLTGPRDGSPNVDSVMWFATEVMPRLDLLLGDQYRLHLAGRADAGEVVALASDRIVLHGMVEDLRPLYDSCRVFVAPTRYAAGIPLKVMEAMGNGLPCAVTELLARQLDGPPSALATGRGADGLAKACSVVYGAESAWRSAREAGFDYVRAYCSESAFERVLCDALAVAAGSDTEATMYAEPSVR